MRSSRSLAFIWPWTISMAGSVERRRRLPPPPPPSCSTTSVGAVLDRSRAGLGVVLDERHDDEGAMAGGDLARDQRQRARTAIARGATSSSVRRMPVPIFCRPDGGVRRSDTSRSAWTIWPSVRGIGVAVISSTCGARALAGQRLALGDAEAVLLVDDDQAQIGELDAPPGRAHGCRRRRVRESTLDRLRRRGEQRRAPRCAAPLAASRSAASTSWPSGSSRRGSVWACWRASRSVGASSAAWCSAPAATAMAIAATAVLPEPTSPWSSRIIGRAPARSVRMSASAAQLIVREANGGIRLDLVTGTRAPRRDLFGDDGFHGADDRRRSAASATSIGSRALALALRAGGRPCPPGARAARRTPGGAARRPAARNRAGKCIHSIASRTSTNWPTSGLAVRRTSTGRYSACDRQRLVEGVLDACPQRGQRRRRPSAGRQARCGRRGAIRRRRRRTPGSGSAAPSRAARPCPKARHVWPAASRRSM